MVAGIDGFGAWYAVSWWKAEVLTDSETSGAKDPRAAASLAKVRLLPKYRFMKSAIVVLYAHISVLERGCLESKENKSRNEGLALVTYRGEFSICNYCQLSRPFR